MVFTTVVVATDLSTPSRRGIIQGLEICAVHEAMAVVVYVMAPLEKSHLVPRGASKTLESLRDLITDANETAARGEWRWLHREARKRAVEVETRIVEGEPGDILVEMSREVDLIVITRLGRGRSRGRLGRVSEQILARASSPVLLVPAPVRSRKRDQDDDGDDDDEGEEGEFEY